MARFQTLNAITDDEHSRIHLKADVERLRRRARFLNSGILASLRGGLCATLLLALLFVSEFFGLKYAYGAGLLFVISTFLLGFALFRFAQEASIGLCEADDTGRPTVPNQSRYEIRILRPISVRNLLQGPLWVKADLVVINAHVLSANRRPRRASPSRPVSYPTDGIKNRSGVANGKSSGVSSMTRERPQHRPRPGRRPRSLRVLLAARIP